jgi:catechol 2,3-dioxygenase-like lactoylglutathione lyase family enzyme
MVRFHHVNLGVPPDGAAAQAAFLTDVLGYRKVDAGERLTAVGAMWFESDDGAQVHLSVDPEHRAAARAHVAIELGDDLPAVEDRLRAAGHEAKVLAGGSGMRVVFCRDPSGNRWELRGDVAGEQPST